MRKLLTLLLLFVAYGSFTIQHSQAQEADYTFFLTSMKTDVIDKSTFKVTSSTPETRGFDFSDNEVVFLYREKKTVLVIDKSFNKTENTVYFLLEDKSSYTYDYTKKMLTFSSADNTKKIQFKDCDFSDR